ncbi:hypothetical protein, partial [Aneurinibacillus tyrosinisolvens]|uniref:hypothetical protein n=1 Tax=Aneurinibacillus tyrosinisolvens TaxID=1443435 RepID=UPI00128AED98
MSVNKRLYFSFLVTLIITTLLFSVLFPYGNVYASEENPGEGMENPMEKKGPALPIPFPKKGNAPKEIKGKRDAKQ